MKNIPFQQRLLESLEQNRERTAVEYYRYDEHDGHDQHQFGSIPSISSISYGEVLDKSARIRDFLLERGVTRGTPVGILTAHRCEIIIQIIGILRAGAIFVPLDTNHPARKIVSFIRRSRPSILLTDSANRQRLEEESQSLPPLETVIIDDAFYNSPGPAVPPATPVDYLPDDGVYIYFTSGSTGEPKCILGRSKGLRHFIDWEIREFRIDSTFRVGQLTSPGFDPYLRDIFVPLCAGGTLCIPADPQTVVHATRLTQWLHRSRVNLLHCVPSIFQLFNAPDPALFPALKYVLLHGERIPIHQLKKWYRTFQRRVQLVNLYGPTETTLAKAFHRIQPEDVEANEIPVGKPIPGARMVVLDRDMNICGAGITGEVYIRTPYRSLGYYKDPELNREKFIVNPFGSDPNDLLYRTGDLGMLLENGNIVLSGRIDRQVKVRGVRIEPGEIEAVIQQHSLVQHAAVTVHVDSRKENHLCAYIVSGYKDVLSQLRPFLLKELPEYMLPSYFIPVDRLPLTPNGKIDRNALPDPQTYFKAHHTPPRNPLEKKLTSIWARLLDMEPDAIGIDSDFFQLGGHSLKVTALVAVIHKEFGVQLQVADIFAAPNIRELAQCIQRTAPMHGDSLRPTPKNDNYPVSSAQRRLYILQEQDRTSAGYNMPQAVKLAGEIDPGKIESIFKQLIQRHESLRTSFLVDAGEIRQQVHEQADFALSYRQSPRQTLPAAMDVFVRPFDPAKAPLLRVELVCTDQREHFLLLDMHHLISDGVSVGILVRDFITLYRGQTLPPPEIHYRDFVYWQQEQERKDDLEEQKRYWLEKFSGPLPVLQLPADLPRPPMMTFEGSAFDFRIPEKETRQIKALVEKWDTSLYMLLFSIFSVFLSRLSGQEEVVVGTVMAGRRHVQLQSVIGLFVNTLVQRYFPAGEKSFDSFHREVKEDLLTAFENQDYQYEDLVRELAPPPDRSRNPLFDVMFVFNNMELPEMESGDLTLETLRYRPPVSQFDIILTGSEYKNMLLFSVEYKTRLFSSRTIEQYIDYFREVLSAVLEDDRVQLKDISIAHRYLNAQPEIGSTDFGF